MFDLGFVLAVAALGWGLSLATYRVLAAPRRWPMGAWQTGVPFIPIIIGALCMLIAVSMAGARIGGGNGGSGWLILIFGLAWAVFWTGFLRVGAQSALLLGPLAAFLLLLHGLR